MFGDGSSSVRFVISRSVTTWSSLTGNLGVLWLEVRGQRAERSRSPSGCAPTLQAFSISSRPPAALAAGRPSCTAEDNSNASFPALLMCMKTSSAQCPGAGLSSLEPDDKITNWMAFLMHLRFSRLKHNHYDENGPSVQCICWI